MRRTKPMNAKTMGALAAAILLGAGTLGAASAAFAEDSIYVPLFTYRTGPFSGSGIPVADGMHDYLEMLNQRDGGIGGVKLVIEECETGYDTKKGIECYEAIKGKKPVMVNPWSTGITLPLIPKAAVDKIPILSMAYGLSASAVGETFPWAFNPPNTYWDGLSMILRYIADKDGGLDKLKGKTIGYLYLDAGFGKEPIPMFEAFAKDVGFTLKMYPVAFGDLQNQSSQWLNVRRDKPDYMVMYGWGAMNGTAVKEAARISYPMDKFISIWWPSEDDARGAGDAAKGFKILNWHATGANFPAIQDILSKVVDKGKSQVASKDKVGEVLYDRGVYNSMLIAEAIANAQKLTGKKVVTGEDVRRGLETIDLTPDRLKQLGFEGFTGPLQITCRDHNGHRPTFMQAWDGQKWVKVSGDLPSMSDKVMPLAEAAAKDYAEKNAGWPKRSEACDKPS
ncbi:amino acid/amide ABC transporter substrate-binding protein, HAAT family [Rhizobiales bacterium GAS191]|jgi:branched-chain amino acid transport system substrate-binding protein|nr:amino acid/amide ABC transporter substrate-binding protein, HAAT family [Rhizobiales bacterium GAS113]SEC04022.1 amino acid/amide ABC transporter substrate-binding protein, HAAT family [Rhizobiales bacterium GAS191]SED15375.1 amino acid/amide ABC transporter substrate-binding protein, HAAT family [Rhizobiales bacterium GAS188]